MNILLVENDPALGGGLRIALKDQGYTVFWVKTLADALFETNSNAIDLILLDLGLPDGDGLTLVADLRAVKKKTPILIITARDTVNDRVAGLDQGADDYLVKPFALAELFSRLRALARRSFDVDNGFIDIRGLAISESQSRVTLDGKKLEFSPSEFIILNLLMKRPDRVLTRQFLQEQVVLSANANNGNLLDVHIFNIRKKIGAGYIRTVRGVGFVIDRIGDDVGTE